MRRGDDPQIDFDGARAPHPFEFLILEQAQQLRLGLQRKIADLVQKNGSFVCQLEASAFLSHGSGKGPLLVAKQLALDQSRGNGGAVHLDQRFGASRTLVVEGAADQLLARAAFSEDQNRGIGRCHQLNLVQHLPQCAALADDLLVVVVRLDLIRQDLARAYLGRLVADHRDHTTSTGDIGC